MNGLLYESSEQLLRISTAAKEQFATLSESDWSAKPSPDKWSKKETLGHLIDSAANNHLRFVRAQLADDIYKGNAYEQNFFVSSQNYVGANTEDLIALWYSYNKQLAHVIKNINPDKLGISCHIGSYPPVTFSFVITDYVSHLEHHLAQIAK